MSTQEGAGKRLPLSQIIALIKAYRKGTSMRELMQTFNVSRQAINQRMIRLGISRRDKTEAQQIRRKHELRQLRKQVRGMRAGAEK